MKSSYYSRTRVRHLPQSQRSPLWSPDLPFAAIGTPRRAKLGDKRRSCSAIPKNCVEVVRHVPLGRKGTITRVVIGYAWNLTRPCGLTRNQLASLRRASGCVRPVKVLDWLKKRQKLADRGILKPAPVLDAATSAFTGRPDATPVTL